MDWVTQLTNVVAAHPLLNLLNVKYILTPPAVEVQDGLGFHLAHKSDLGVLENLEVWPRAFFCDKIVSLSSTEEFVEYLRAHSQQPFVGLTPVEISRQAGLAEMSGVSSIFTPATNYTLLPNSTAFDIHAKSGGIACLTEGKGRDFTARVNGEPKPILTVNRAFKGIYLAQPGDYHIEFTYRPRYWRCTWATFWVAVGISTGLLLFDFFRSKKVEVRPNPAIQIP